MAELNAHFPGRRVVSGGRLAQNGLPSDNARPVQTAKRKASAEFTPSALNGLPLRHVKSAALLGRQDKTRRLDKVEDVEDSPRIKRMRVDRSAAANERNGGETSRTQVESLQCVLICQNAFHTGRARTASGFGMVTALANGTKNTVSTVKKRLSGGPDTLLSKVDDRAPHAPRRIASGNKHSVATEGLPGRNTAASTQRDMQSSQSRSYAKSSRPPPPIPNGLSELGLRTRAGASSTQPSSTLPSSLHDRPQQTSRIPSYRVVSNGSATSRTSMLRSHGEKAGPTVATERGRSTVPALVQRDNNQDRERKPSGIPSKLSNPIPGALCPAAGPADVKAKEPHLTKSVTRTTTTFRTTKTVAATSTQSPARVRSRLRSPTVIGVRGRVSHANLRMAAKQHELVTKRSQMEAERGLREALA